MMYASPIEIKKDPQEIVDTIEIDLENAILTLDDLRKYINEGEKFFFGEREEQFGNTPILYIYRKRFETQEEVEKRVVKEEKYMENYKKFHVKYG